MDATYLNLDNPMKLQILKEPEETFIIKNKPTTITCVVANALHVFIECNNEPLKELRHDKITFVEPEKGVRITEAKANVTRKDVESYFGDFHCNCLAWSSQEKVRSRKINVHIACK